MRYERLVWCGALAALAAGCADRPEPIETGMATADGDVGTAMLRVVHAGPESGKLSVYRGTEEASEPLAYLDTHPWVAVAAGDGELSVLRVSDMDGEAAVALDEWLEPGALYTIVAYEDEGEVRARLLEDDQERDPARVRLRVLNLIDDGPEVELFVRGGRERLLDDIEPGEVEEAWTAPTERALELRREGERAPYLVVPKPLEAGRGYTLVLTGTGERPDVVRVEDED